MMFALLMGGGGNVSRCNLAILSYDHDEDLLVHFIFLYIECIGQDNYPKTKGGGNVDDPFFSSGQQDWCGVIALTDS